MSPLSAITPHNLMRLTGSHGAKSSSKECNEECEAIVHVYVSGAHVVERGSAGAAGGAAVAPNMTFFVTSAGPGKGADLGGLEGADRHRQTLAQAAGVGSKTWRAYSASRQWAARRPSIPAIALDAGPGRILKARSSRNTSMIFKATPTSSVCRCR